MSSAVVYPFSKDWHARAWVRSGAADEAVGHDVGPGSRYFPEALVPLARAARDLGPDVLFRAHVGQLYRYLHFTRALEIATVNPVAQAIAIPSPEAAFLTRLPAAEREALAREAYRLYCDEAFHAVAANDLIASVEAHTGIPGPRMHDDSPSYLESLRLERERAGSPERSFLLLFGFVCVSETLVSRTLAQLPLDGELAAPVRRFAREHLRDEAWHAHFFSQVFLRVWARLADDERRFLGTRLPGLIRLFLTPDARSLDRELEGYGVAAGDRAAITGDLALRPEGLRSAAAGCLKLFLKAGVFELGEARDAFAAEGF